MQSPFEDALGDLRITGNVLLHDCYLAPWAIEVPEQPVLQSLMGVDWQTRVVPFHLVRKGGFQLAMNGVFDVAAGCDDVVVCTGGKPHRMRSGKANKAIPLQDLLGRKKANPVPAHTEATELICGVFMLKNMSMNPLLSALPDVLVCPTSGPDANPLLGLAAQMLAADVCAEESNSSGYTRSRLLEIFCAEAIRSYQKQLGSASVGWLQGLNDPKIAVALAHIHASPEKAWTVDRLAGSAALSPSRFAARFRDRVGITVMDYVARWRMNVACRLLADHNTTVEAVAFKVGYGSATAFSNAFRNMIGLSPAKWRVTSGRAD